MSDQPHQSTPGDDTGSTAADPLRSRPAEQSEPTSVLSGFSWDDPAAGAPPAGQDPYAAAPQPASGSQPPPYAAQPYGQPAPTAQPYQPPAPYAQQSQYGGTAHGPAPLSPEQEKVRSSAILWTILNGVGFFFGNFLSIPGVIVAAIAISKVRDDVTGARTLVKWAWILFAAGFALGLLLIIGVVALAFGSIGLAGLSGGF